MSQLTIEHSPLVAFPGYCPRVYDDGGRRAAGFGPETNGGCVARAIAIATGTPYVEVWASLLEECRDWNISCRRPRGRKMHPDGRVPTSRITAYMKRLGWRYVPIHRGHFRNEQLPPGHIIVDMPRHVCAVIDYVAHDTFDCVKEGRARINGYWYDPAERESLLSGEWKRASGALRA